MALRVLRNGRLDIFFVGCDRVASNWYTANSIGASGIAILAKYYGMFRAPFMESLKSLKGTEG